MAAIIFSIAGFVASVGISVVALYYAHRADRRTARAEATGYRIETLQQIHLHVHEMIHATDAAVAGDLFASAKGERHRAQLQAALSASGVSLPKCQAIADGLAVQAYGPEWNDAMAELARAIQVERNRLIRPEPHDTSTET